MLFFPIEDNKTVDHFQSIYSYMSVKKRTLFLYGEVGPYSPFASGGRNDTFSTVYVADAILALNEMSSEEPIKLLIDSVGGDIRSGLILYDTIQTSKAPVYTFGRMAYSMAAILLSSGAPGHRYIYENAHVMLHLPFGQYAGDPAETRAWANEMEKVKDKLVALLIKHGAKKTREQILADIDRKFWLTGQDAINYGIADKFVEAGDL